MSDQTDAFSTNPDTTGNQPPQDPFANHLSAIRNEDGQQKYNSVEDALKGAQHAQEFIPQLKSELHSKDEEIARLKAEMDKLGSVEDVVSRLTQSQQAPTSQETPVDKGLDQERVSELVDNLLAQKERESALKANRQLVSQTLQESFGDKVSEVVAGKAKELGITVDYLAEMSSKSPGVVLNLFNPSKQDGATSPTTSSVNTSISSPEPEPLKVPDGKSLLRGATAADQRDYWNKIQGEIYKKYNIEN
jgi:hypothetical protein